MEDQVSQYTQPAVELRVGSPHTSYYVPKAFLAQYPKLLNLINTSRNIVKIPKVDKDVGYTLVHFLYCSKYQTLSPQGAKEAPDNKREYRRGVLIYCTARSYEINGLVDHALNAIDQFGKDLTIAQILDAVCEVYAQLPEHEVWLPNYLKAHLETAFEQDMGIFGRKEFMKHIGINVTWSQFLVKIMADILAEKSLRELQEPDEHAADQLREEDFEILPRPSVKCGNVDAENWPSPPSVEIKELTPNSEHFSVDELLPEVQLEPKMPVEEGEPRTPASGQTLASLEGRPIETNGDVIDNDGNVIAMVINGKPRQMAKKQAKCNAHGNVVFGSKILGTVELVLPEPESEQEPEAEAPPSPPSPAPEEPPVELKGRSLASLEGLEISQSGYIHDHDNTVVGKLVEGSALNLYANFAVCTADGQAIANGKILKNARVEIIEPEPEPEPEPVPELGLEHGVPTLASLDGRTLEENGDILNDDGQVIGKLVGGVHKPNLLFKNKASCDAEGKVWAKDKQVPSAKVEVVVPEKSAAAEDQKPVDERSVCPERVNHVFGDGGSWKTCRKCRSSISEMANQL